MKMLHCHHLDLICINAYSVGENSSTFWTVGTGLLIMASASTSENCGNQAKSNKMTSKMYHQCWYGFFVQVLFTLKNTKTQIQKPFQIVSPQLCFQRLKRRPVTSCLLYNVNVQVKCQLVTWYVFLDSFIYVYICLLHQRDHVTYIFLHQSQFSALRDKLWSLILIINLTQSRFI